MINGAAVGSGMDMALHCDIRIGCEHTRFIGYQQLGQIMENGGCYYLPKMVGTGTRVEFAYIGQIDAQRAYEWGCSTTQYPLTSSRKRRGTCVSALCARHRWYSGSANALCVPRWIAP